jgi:SAM-dependent methyltransferase
MGPDALQTCLCGGRAFATVFDYRAPPEGEVRFAFAAGTYRRVVVRCERCGHFLSRHDMDAGALYNGAYVEATYGADGLRRAFDRVTALPPGKSDNAGRVDAVIAFARRHFGGRAPSVLDVGSGLCVFLHRLKRETGWPCTALDPDERAARHAREVAGVEARCGDFMTLEATALYNMVTLNKVLEHVPEPVAMLRRTLSHLAPGGAVYIELPDGESAVHEGPGREEFFIDHPHVFSLASMRILAGRAGFRVLEEARLREPSGKFTLRGFLAPEAGA